MHQTKKGKQWHFGMKAHIGVDAESGLVHTVIGTAANINDVTQGHGLLHGQETVVFADAGYQGAAKRPEATGGGSALAGSSNESPADQSCIELLKRKTQNISKVLSNIIANATDSHL